VRELVKDGKYEDIKNLVPASTYEFLMNSERVFKTSQSIGGTVI
jgi:citrate lyase synthetase